MRRAAIFAGAFSLGIFLAQYLLPGGWLLPGAFACLFLACGALYLPHPWRKRLFLAFVGLSLALGYDWLYVRQVQRPMEALAGTETAAVMTLCDYAVPTRYGARAEVRVQGLPGKVVYYGGGELLDGVPGQRVTDTVLFQSASRIREDDVTTFTSKGIFLLAYQRGTALVEQGRAASPRWWPVRVGQAMRQLLRELFGPDTAPFLAAILTGDRSGLSVQDAADLSEAGLYHVLAVSGMHCGFLLAMVTFFAGRHRRRLVAGCTIALVLFYAVLTGGSPSVLRACVMLTLLVAAPLLRRESDSPTSLAVALFLILLADPFAAASISLQLSFAAVAGILFLSGRMYRFLLHGRSCGRIVRFAASSVSVTMGALAFTAPLSAWYFGTLSLISPVSNLLCLWAVGGVFLLGLGAVAAGFLWLPLGRLIAVLPALLVRYILWVAHGLAGVPFHAVYFDGPYLPYWMGLVYLLFAAAWLLGAARRRTYLLAAGLSAAALPLTLWLGAARYSAGVDGAVLDVGQGQSVVLSSGSVSAVVDCGSANSWYGPGESAAHRLKSMGHHKLDYLIVTHFDADHVNGIPALLARIPVETVLVPAAEESEMRTAVLSAAAEQGAGVETVEQVRRIAFGRGELTVLPPVGEEGSNERGLTVLTTAGETDLLITGDMDASTEEALLAAWDLPDIEMLVAGHHGSRTSTSDVLLEAVTPESVCVSVGVNSYGHPAEETLRRIAAHDCAVYRTDMQGDIRLSLN